MQKEEKVVLGITGTPGTGKKSVGKRLSELIGFGYLDINEVAIQSGSIVGEDAHGFIADVVKLKAYVKRLLKGNIVIVGHLLPSVLSPSDVKFVAVLRCSPIELERRLEQRGYSREKLLENVQAEVLDVCLHEAVRRFGVRKVGEFETTKDEPLTVAKRIMKTVLGEEEPRIGIVDWLSYVYKMGLWNRYFPP